MRKPSPQGGYNMVMLMVAITVLNIMVAIALPMWSQEIQRDKEEELISRGWQYVEAIRVFQNRFQRPPVRLEELVEVKPRSIRRLWKDPMTDGKMQPIFQNEGQPLTVQPGVQQPQQGQDNPEGMKQDPKAGQPDPNAAPQDPNAPVDANGDKPQALNGPIVGVRSRSNKKSILVFFGKERYDQWRFTIDQFNQVRQPPPGGTPGVGGAPGAGAGGPLAGLSTRWLGRPFPGVQTTDNLPKPGDLMPGGNNSSGNRKPGGRMLRSN